MGKELAREYPVDADMVIGVPDSATASAVGYSEESGIPFGEGLVKNRYVGRTFINPDQRMREVFPDHFDGGAPPREEPSRKSVVAPATRAGKPPRKVTLNSTQVDLAKKLGLTTEQYANQVAKDMAHGR